MNRFFQRKNFSYKIFVGTAVSFIAIICFSLLFQSLFFEKFYIYKKTYTINQDLENLKKQLLIKWNDNQPVEETISSFESRNGSKIVILDNTGNLKFITTNLNERKDYNRVYVINKILQNWQNNPQSLAKLSEKNKTTTYVFQDNSNGIKNLVSVSPIKVGTILYGYLFSVSSLQPINEAAGVIKEFYLYILGLATILIIILLYIYFSFSSLKKSNEKLLEDIKRERKLETMRKEFVAGVSHELKTPISLIEGYAEGIKDGIASDEDQSYYIDVIIDEARKMGNLVTDMLDISQIEQGSFKLSCDNFFLDDLLNDTLKKYENIFKENCIEVNTDIHKNLKVYGDRNRIEQVITNILTNAIRHTDKNKVIYIICKSTDKGVLTSIENEGNTIPEESLSKIWDKFFKLDKSRSRELGGTGLGLSIVKSILVKHNSDFNVENTERGVKFKFIIKEAL